MLTKVKYQYLIDYVLVALLSNCILLDISWFTACVSQLSSGTHANLQTKVDNLLTKENGYVD